MWWAVTLIFMKHVSNTIWSKNSLAPLMTIPCQTASSKYRIRSSLAARKSNGLKFWGKYLTNVVSRHSDIYETCVKRNLGQKIRLLLRRQSFVKQPLQTHKLVHVPGEEVLLGRSSAFLIKFIYSEKATKFCEISTIDLTVTT